MQSIAEFLRSRGIRLNTDLGQHFLVDPSVLSAIIDTANISPEDHIVEIGPGIGILTAELLKRARHITAIELDTRMIPLLTEWIRINEKTNKRKNDLTVINANALHVPMPDTPYHIVANIPYHITSPLLRHVFLESPCHPQSMTLLIQREVAEKICDEDDRGMLSILVGLFGVPKLIRMVPPSAFLPPPAVDSAVLHIACFPSPKASPEIITEVFRLTKIAFGQRRKMLRNSFGPFPDIMERLLQLAIDEKRRPQTLSIDEWIALAS